MKVQIKEFTLDELQYPKIPLAKHYHKKLLIPGWAGELTDTELKYIKDNLLSNPDLRQCWGFIHGKGYRINNDLIGARALA